MVDMQEIWIAVFLEVHPFPPPQLSPSLIQGLCLTYLDLQRVEGTSILSPLSPMLWHGGQPHSPHFRFTWPLPIYYLFVVCCMWCSPDSLPEPFAPGSSDNNRISSSPSWHVPDTHMLLLPLLLLLASTQLGRHFFFVQENLLSSHDWMKHVIHSPNYFSTPL